MLAPFDSLDFWGSVDFHSMNSFVDLLRTHRPRSPLVTVVFSGFAALAIATIGTSVPGVPWREAHAIPSSLSSFLWTFVLSFSVIISYAGALQRGLALEQRELRDSAEAELDASKHRFISRISQALRNPLTGIVGFGHMLAEIERGAVTNLTVSDCIDPILWEAGELGRMIDDLLVCGQLDNGTLPFKRRDASIESEILKVVTRRIPSGRIELTLNPAMIYVDPDAFQHVVRNLISNAEQHGRAPVIVDGFIHGSSYVITVKDRGAGIDGGWHPETPTSRTSEDSSNTVGLGLSVANRLAERLDGSLSYRRAGGVTQFRLAVPLSVGSSHYRYVAGGHFIRESLARLGLIEALQTDREMTESSRS